MASMRSWLGIVLVLYAVPNTVMSLDNIFCQDWVDADTFCQMIFKHSFCNKTLRSCECLTGYMEKDNHCVEDFYVTRKHEYEIEMVQMEQAAEDTDEYLSRYRRQDQLNQPSGDGAGARFAFGAEEGDSSLTGTNDGCRRISLGFNVPCGTRRFRRFYICANGIVCFGRPYFNSAPPNNKVRESFLVNRYCYAPYHADIDLRQSGTVWYRGMDLTEEDGAEDESVLLTKQFVRSSYGIDIDPLYIFRATWHEAPRRSGRSSERVTVQCIYVTDGNWAAVFYFYIDGAMLFEAGKQFIGIINNGFPDGLQDNLSNDFLRRPDRNVVFKSERGFTTFLLTRRSLITNYEALCKQWFRNEKKLLSQYRSDFNRMPICPCAEWFFRFDSRFRRVSFDFFTGISTWAPVRIPRNSFSGKTCTYWRGRLITSRRHIGRFQAYNRLVFPYEHFVNDILGENICWFGFGDPHISSIDGLDYTFNGHGEYILLKDINQNFEIQTRTERALSADNSTVEATIYSAFVIQTEQAWVQIELKKSASGLNLFLGSSNNDWADYTFDFANDSLSYIDGELSVIRENETLIASFSDTGLNFEVTESYGVLQFSIALSNVYKNKTIGLLGNFNDDKTDDLRPRGASAALSDSSADSVIFRDFGQTWMTSATESLFKYDPGKGHADYSFPAFEPKFIDEADPTLVAKAVDICGKGKKQCIFDYVFTRRDDLAIDANKAIEKADENKATIANKAPMLEIINGTTVIEGEHYVYINLNGNKNIVLRGEDDGTLTYELVNTTAKATIGSPANDGTFQVNLIVDDINPVFLSVVAKDDKGVYSPDVEFVIVLCTLCNARGECDNTVIREDEKATDNFMYATCNCEEYWEGDDCQDDFDGCEGTPCSLGRTCTDTPANQHQANPDMNAVSCGPCPSGYQEDDIDCIDIDECTGSVCDQICVNTVGSYYCECESGYRLAENARECTDLNECDEFNGDCQQLCTNSDGGFNCSCYIGFTFNEATLSCDKDTSPPTGCDQLDCSESAGCTLDESSNATCFCNAGYKLENNNTCTNINECNANPCSQTCTDNEGDFTCSCYTGHELKLDKTSCEPCKVPYYGDNCASICECGPGSAGCDPVTGCVCTEAWNGTDCTTDADECEDLNICGDINKECVNAVGFYTCECRSGYELDENEQCVDIDECIDPAFDTCSQICTNAVGGFSCSCRSGFVVNATDNTKCIDFDECEAKVSDCEHICMNNAGRFSCDCAAGYVLNEDDRRTCALADDPCAEFENVACSQICSLANGAPVCSCRLGFTLSTDSQTCVDVDECDADLNLNECSEKDKCVNANGGYSCSCSAGFKLENDKRTCIACDSAHFGVNCASECACGPGAMRCDPESGCACGEGWTGDKCQFDKNECANFPCTGDNIECLNIPGSFLCNCKAGYEADDSNACQDVDECKITPPVCSQNCNNSVGSYTCSCNVGFRQDGANCIDFNECQGQNDCAQICTNTFGNYRCSCETGFKLDLTDRRTCIPSENCDNATNPCGQNADCSVVDGTDTCFCKAGFKFVSESTTACEDILECSRDQSPCSQLCTETSGGYQCSCNMDGYKLDTDQSTCVVCSGDKYGDDCLQNCMCNVSNTLSCNNVDGGCNCTTGWSGSTCDTDINECNDPAVHKCPTNTQCIDTDGSFFCKCDTGYITSAEGTCQACDEGTFGDECKSSCPCNASNTDTCRHTDGKCTCKSGWEGNTCNENIDECTRNTFVCPAKTTCEDIAGSYLCNCDTGFIKTISGTSCEVCAQGSFGVDCKSVCPCVRTNTESCNSIDGSCTCNAGWEGATCNLQCVDSFGKQCANQCNCDDGKSSGCDPVTGCVCNPGWQGVNCTLDIDECTSNPNSCGANEFCTNTEGNYTCSCNTGYIKEQGICKECSNNMHGDNCSTNCNCVHNNTMNPTQSCDSINGTCYCTQYWEGTRCEMDIDECVRNTDNCTKPNEGCHNIDGGFVCSCLLGSIKDNSNSCVAVTTPAQTTPAGPGTRVSVRVVLTLNITIIGDLTVTLTFDIYEQEVRTKLEVYYRQRLGNVTFTIIINSLKTGSLLADFIVILPESSLPDLGVANADLATNKGSIDVFNNTGPTSSLVVGDKQIPVSVGEPSDALVCQAYEASFSGCGAGYTCLVTEGKPGCQVVEDNFPLAFGLGFGIPMFLLCAVAGIVFAVYWRQRREKLQSKREDDDRSSSLFGRRVPVRMITGAPGPIQPQPDLPAYESSTEYLSEYTDYDPRYDDEVGRQSRSTWNYLFHNNREGERYHIKRPKVDQEPWTRYF